LSKRFAASYWGLALLAGPLLTGCGDDAPLPPARLSAAPPVPRRAYSAAPRPSVTASVPTAQTPDALEASDGLLSGTGQDAASATVPFNTPAGPPLTPPADTADALTQSSDPLAGSVPGQRMPTQHSHWLRGSIFNARVQVCVNGLFLGTFTSPQDRDITMKLRGGINTVTLAYTPLTSTASAHLDILESEHDPPIPPLATFRSPLSSPTPRAPLQTTTQTLTFLAR